jgi:hypothetical protein
VIINDQNVGRGCHGLTLLPVQAKRSRKIVTRCYGGQP